MKKTLQLCSTAALIAVGAVAANAQTYVYETFNAAVGGVLPASWTSTPANNWKTGAPDAVAPDFSALGVSGNTPAHMKAVAIDGNVIAANGAILSTPSINLPASATGAKLIFDKFYFGARLTSDASKKETFTLLSSIDGGTTWTDLTVINPNSANSWKDTTINIGSLAGQANLKFGFKYENTNTALVGAALDNIRVYIQGASDIALTAAAPAEGDANGYKMTGGTATITGSVYNYGSAPLTSYVVKYKQGSNAVQSYTASGSIAPLTGGTFTHSVPFTVPSAGTFPIKVWVELTGDSYHNDDTANAQVVGVAFMPVKRLVFEEGTGTWCQWCPRGNVRMEELAETFPGKASQIAVHNADPMTVAAYDNFMGTNFPNGYPNVITDRTKGINTDPGNIISIYNANKDNFGFAEFTMGTPTVTGTSVSVPVTILPAATITNPKLSLVVTESNVTGTGSSWNQKNAYAGGGQGVMGGWETRTSSVSGVNFHFVARSITPSPAGEASGLPATLVAGTTYTATLTATLNAAWKSVDLQYIAMLIDGNNGKVLNSAQSALPTLSPGLPPLVSVTNVEAGINNARLYPNPTNGSAYIQLDLATATSTTVNIVDGLGRSVVTPVTSQLKSGTSTMEINTQTLSAGVYFVQVMTKNGQVSLKLQVTK